jgi:hypothetical protein
MKKVNVTYTKGKSIVNKFYIVYETEIEAKISTIARFSHCNSPSKRKPIFKDNPRKEENLK